MPSRVSRQGFLPTLLVQFHQTGWASTISRNEEYGSLRGSGWRGIRDCKWISGHDTHCPVRGQARKLSQPWLLVLRRGQDKSGHRSIAAHERSSVPIEGVRNLRSFRQDFGRDDHSSRCRGGSSVRLAAMFPGFSQRTVVRDACVSSAPNASGARQTPAPRPSAPHGTAVDLLATGT